MNLQTPVEIITQLEAKGQQSHICIPQASGGGGDSRVSTSVEDPDDLIYGKLASSSSLAEASCVHATASATPMERSDQNSPVAQKASMTAAESGARKRSVARVAIFWEHVVGVIANKLFATAKTAESRRAYCVRLKWTYYAVHSIILFTLYWFAVWDVSPLWIDRTIGCTQTVVEPDQCGFRGEFCKYRNMRARPRRVVCSCECANMFEKNDEKNPAINVYGGRGDDVYAASSAICPAAIHAGFVSNEGGSVKLRILPGARFYSDGGTRHGIRSKPLGHYVMSMKFEPDDTEEEDFRRTAVREAYFGFMVISVLAFVVVFIPNTLLLKYESTHLGMSQTPDHTVCSATEYVLFLTINGVMYSDLVLNSFSAQDNLVRVTSDVVFVGIVATGLHAHYFRHVFEEVPACRGWLCLFALSFSIGLRFAIVTSVVPQIGLKTRGAMEQAEFSSWKVAMLVAYIVACCALACFIIRDFFIKLGRTKARNALAKIVSARLVFIAGLFVLQWLLSDYTVHVHHYFVGLVTATIARLPTKSHSIAAGLGFGICVEGISRWGWEMNFDPDNSKKRLAFKTPKLNATVMSEQDATVFWSEPNEKFWTKLYVNDILWYDNVTLPSWNLTGLTPNTTNYVDAISMNIGGDFEGSKKSPKTEIITAIDPVVTSNQTAADPEEM